MTGYRYENGKRVSVPEADRFYPRLNKTIGPIHYPELGRCWVLMEARNPEKMSKYRASRMAWKAQCGEIPDGLQVLHKCDIEYCVRPDHLFLGTISDNVKDAFSKGRKSGFPGNQHALGHKQSDEAKRTKGVKSKASWEARKKKGEDGFKLTKEQVLEIRARYRKWSYHGNNCRELAKEYGVSRGQINRIVRGTQRNY